MIDLIPVGFPIGEPLARTDSTPLTVLAKDEYENEYRIEFTFRNQHRSLIDKAVKHLKPCRSFIDTKTLRSRK